MENYVALVIWFVVYGITVSFDDLFKLVELGHGQLFFVFFFFFCKLYFCWIVAAFVAVERLGFWNLCCFLSSIYRSSCCLGNNIVRVTLDNFGSHLHRGFILVTSAPLEEPLERYGTPRKKTIVMIFTPHIIEWRTLIYKAVVDTPRIPWRGQT